MSDLRDRIAKLISDSSAYAAGQQEERRRLQHLIDIRVDELRKAGSVPQFSAIRSELFRIRQQLDT